jgi:hypothetical protein
MKDLAEVCLLNETNIAGVQGSLPLLSASSAKLTGRMTT